MPTEWSLGTTLVRKRKKSSPLNPFYGYPAKLIAEWCGVSVGTAEHYKAGRRKPPTPVLRLFRLYRDKKILSDEYWEDFHVVDDKIFGPNDRPMRPSDFSHWGLIWQALAEAAPKKYHELLKKVSNS